MNRVGLTALVTTALLSTSIQPFDSSESAEHEAVVTTAALPPVAAAPPLETLPVALEREDIEQTKADARSARDDSEILEILFARLSSRHTTLSPRERRRVAETILFEARAHDLEPELVIAVIEVESAGYSMAVSHVGARGLMQLMPATGEEIARKRGIPWRGNDTLFDPVVNVRLGTFYLRQLADKYSNVTVALAAYNWGPGAIDRRIASGQTVPALYIEQVMAAYDRETPRLAANAY